MDIALGITGCIAAYKAIDVMRGLQKEGAGVQVVLTRAARRFVTPLTFEALSGNPVITDMFQRGRNLAIEHIQVAQKADLLAIVPATANMLGKCAHGIADDFLSTLYLSCPAPVVLAPAMNVEMWNHAAVRANVEILRSRGHRIIEPEVGDLACRMWGNGRLARVDVIVDTILQCVRRSSILAGRRVLVTAGPTVEDIDPVRFLSNRSSGKMGYAMASAARAHGADVLLISGPTSLPVPAGVRTVSVRSAEEMKEAVMAEFADADIVIMAAAVSDYRPVSRAASKLKKSGDEMALALAPNEDILLALGREKRRQVLVGFAAETESVVENARDKMARKGADLCVANDVSAGVFGAESATVWLLQPDRDPLEMRQVSKRQIAESVVKAAAEILSRRRDGAPASQGSFR